MKTHRKRCQLELVLCNRCESVTVPRHLLNKHQSESCFGLNTCNRCQAEYRVNLKHDLEHCVDYLALRVNKLKKEKVDRDEFVNKLLKKLDKDKQQLLHEEFERMKLSSSKQKEEREIEYVKVGVTDLDKITDL